MHSFIECRRLCLYFVLILHLFVWSYLPKDHLIKRRPLILSTPSSTPSGLTYISTISFWKSITVGLLAGATCALLINLFFVARDIHVIYKQHLFSNWDIFLQKYLSSKGTVWQILFFLTLSFGGFEARSQAERLKTTKLQREEKTVFVGLFPYYCVC